MNQLCGRGMSREAESKLLQELKLKVHYIAKYSLTCLNLHMKLSDIPFLIHRV